jgi:hypothetical protein
MVLDSFTLAVEGTLLSAGGGVGALAGAGDRRFRRHETRGAEERTLGKHCRCRCNVWVVVVLLAGRREDGMRFKLVAKPGHLPAAACRFADRPLAVMSAEGAQERGEREHFIALCTMVDQ